MIIRELEWNVLESKDSVTSKHIVGTFPQQVLAS